MGVRSVQSLLVCNYSYLPAAAVAAEWSELIQRASSVNQLHHLPYSDCLSLSVDVSVCLSVAVEELVVNICDDQL